MYSEARPFAEFHETEPIDVETLVVFDIDRTVFDTERFRSEFALTAQRFGVDMAALAEARRESEVIRKKTFQELEFIFNALGEPDSEHLRDVFLSEHADSEFLYPDAVPTFELLQELNLPFVFSTHGPAHTQKLKMATSLWLQSAPYQIIEQPNKGFRFVQMFQEGRFEFAPDDSQYPFYRARRIVHFDDKAENFAGVPENMPVVMYHLHERSRASDSTLALQIEPTPISTLIDAHEDLRQYALAA